MRDLSIRTIIFGWTILLVAVGICGCPEQSGQQSTNGAAPSPTASLSDQPAAVATDKRFANTPVYPIPRSDRPYQNVHASADQAWFLVETAYFVVKDKYLSASKLLQSKDPAERERGSALRTEVSSEIDSSIFVVNENVEALFKEAITAEPDNPLNHATYAYYLKPRKREIESGKFIDTETQALEEIDRAIELWPDESSFYLLKVNILADTHKCHDWLRSQMAENLVITQRLDMIRDLCDKAEQYYPDNHYVNYRRALLVIRYTPPDQYSTIQDEVLDQLHKGNQKPEGFFNYPVPLPPYPTAANRVRLTGNETGPKFIDQWTFFGHYDPRSISMLIDGIVPTLTWPEDKEKVADLMYFLYQIGRTRPFDRSMFSLQLKVLNPLLTAEERGSADALKLAEALRFLDQQYLSVAQEMYSKGLIADATKVDVRGINEIEIGGTHMNNVQVAVQGPQASYLHRAGEILGIDFPLPENPKLW